MQNINKVMLPAVIFLMLALMFPDVSILITCALTFVWGFLTAFVLMALVICYLFFSSFIRNSSKEKGILSLKICLEPL